MDRVVKGLMGYSSEKEGKPATHVILTVEEYDTLKRELLKSQNDVKKIVEQAKKNILESDKKAEDSINHERDICIKRIKAIQSDFKQANDEIQRLTNLNSNLSRIMRERANAKRSITPKKEHHGYVILETQQYIYNHHYKKSRNSDKLECWKTKIQSPYDVSIPYDTIKKTIEQDLCKTFGSSLGVVGIYNIDSSSYEGFHRQWSKDENIIFRQRYKADIRSGLWEVEYLSKLSITIPTDMRIAKKEKVI